MGREESGLSRGTPLGGLRAPLSQEGDSLGIIMLAAIKHMRWTPSDERTSGFGRAACACVEPGGKGTCITRKLNVLG